jgi:hypothetical protein
MPRVTRCHYLVRVAILLIALVGLVAVLAGSSTWAVSDTSSSDADSNILGNEVTTSQTQAINSWASATITITMYTGDEEQASWRV